MLSAAAGSRFPAACHRLLQAAGGAQSAWARGFAAEAGPSIKEVASDADFDQTIKGLAGSNAIAVVDFTAKWCGPCRAIAPLFEQLSKQYPQAVFVKVDIDNEQLQRTVMDHGITGVPTFTFYKGPTRVESFTGARADLLKATLDKLHTQ